MQELGNQKSVLEEEKSHNPNSNKTLSDNESRIEEGPRCMEEGGNPKVQRCKGFKANDQSSNFQGNNEDGTQVRDD